MWCAQNKSRSEFFSAVFTNLSSALQHLLSDVAGTCCCRPRHEKPHRRSLTSTGALGSAQVPAPAQLVLIPHLGRHWSFKGGFLSSSVELWKLSCRKQMWLFFLSGVLLNTWFLDCPVAFCFLVEQRAGSMKKDKSWPQTLVWSFSPCLAAQHCREESWWGKKCNHLLSQQ